MESLFLKEEEKSFKEVDTLFEKEASTLKTRIQKAKNNEGAELVNGRIFLDLSGKIDELVSLIEKGREHGHIIEGDKNPRSVVQNMNGYKKLHKVCADMNVKIELASNADIKIAADGYDFTDEQAYKGKHSKFIIISPNKPYNESSDAHLFSKKVAKKSCLQLNS